MNLDGYDFTQDQLERAKNINHALADLYSQLNGVQKCLDESGLHFSYVYRSFAVIEQLATNNKEHLEEALKKLEVDLNA